MPKVASACAPKENTILARSTAPLPQSLKHRRDFAALYDVGYKVNSRYAVILARCLSEHLSDCPEVGYTVSRRCGNAVKRNRIKRRFKAIIRELASDLLPKCHYVIIGKYGTHDAPYAEIREDIKYGLIKLQSMLRRLPTAQRELLNDGNAPKERT